MPPPRQTLLAPGLAALLGDEVGTDTDEASETFAPGGAGGRLTTFRGLEAVVEEDGELDETQNMAREDEGVIPDPKRPLEAAGKRPLEHGGNGLQRPLETVPTQPPESAPQRPFEHRTPQRPLEVEERPVEAQSLFSELGLPQESAQTAVGDAVLGPAQWASARVPSPITSACPPTPARVPSPTASACPLPSPPSPFVASTSSSAAISEAHSPPSPHVYAAGPPIPLSGHHTQNEENLLWGDDIAGGVLGEGEGEETPKEMTGWLTKETHSLFAGARERWCVAKGGFLMYYRSPNDTEPR